MKEYKEIAEDILEILQTRESVSLQNLLEILQEKYALSKKEQKQMVACGRQTVFFNRVTLARTYLVKQKKIVIAKDDLIQKF